MADVLWNLENVIQPGDFVNRLDDVSLEVCHGGTAVIGYSGAGKTSLLNLLAQMEAAASGSVVFTPPNGWQDSFSLPLFWVPQDGGLWPHLTIEEHIQAVVNAETPWNWLESPTDESSGSLIDNLLTCFDLIHRRGALPGKLSKGEQSRLSVARCLAAAPAVMLMDEPLAHTDPVRRPAYWKLIRRYVEHSNASLVFSTHEPDFAIRESKHVVCLSEGRVIYSGSTTTLYSTPPDEESGRFLGPLNWFAPNEVPTWLGHSSSRDNSIALRPESIQLENDENGPFKILSFQFCGSYAETLLQVVSSSEQRMIYHRPIGNVFQPGQRVQLHNNQ